MRVLAASAWAALVLIAAAHLVYIGQNGFRFGSDLMALLPQDESDPARNDAVKAVTASLNRKFLVLVGHPDRMTARAAATRIVGALDGIGIADSAIGGETGDEVGRLYFRYRNGLLSPADRQRLVEGRGKEIAERALGQIYGLAGGGSASLVRADPFLLFPAFLSSLPLPESRFKSDAGMLTARDGGIWWVLLSYRLKGKAFALAQQNILVRSLDDAYAQARRDSPDLAMLRTGAVFFAHAGAQKALAEMTLIATVSVLCIFVMVLVVFRAIGPLWQSLLAIGVGVLCALSVSLAAFREVHVIALLFGSSLIGTTVDYSMHYCCEAFSAETDPKHRLQHVLPGMLLGVLTTLIGYLALLLAPFPGLHQIAVFSTVGVVASFATVVFWFPVLDRRGYSAAGEPWLRLTRGFWSFRESSTFRKYGSLLLGVLIVAAIVGMTRLETVDDIRRMQSPSRDLLEQQTEIQRLAGVSTATSYFLVDAPDSETALVREEALLTRLETLRAEGLLSAYRSPAGFVPSAKRQRDNAQLVTDRLLTTHLRSQLDRLGLPAVTTSPEAPLSTPLTTRLAMDVVPFLRDLIVEGDGGSVSHILLLDNPKNTDRLRAAADGVDGVSFIDPATDISRLLRKYRHAAVMLIAASAILMIGALAWRYGLRGALRVMSPPVAAVLLTPGLLALAGRGFTFFDAMGLVLVLAIGVDYAVFSAESPDSRQPVTLLAITLAAVSTLLSFGLLAFSSTAAVQAFGATMLCGIGLVFLLSPLAGGVRRRAPAMS